MLDSISGKTIFRQPVTTMAAVRLLARPRSHRISKRTSERKPHHAVDANGNSLMVTVQTAYGFKITVHPAYASKFQKFFALLKERGYKVPAHMTKCWARTARMSRVPTTTSVPPATFRRVGIAGPSSSIT
jgi:hypothetical protein